MPFLSYNCAIWQLTAVIGSPIPQRRNKEQGSFSDGGRSFLDMASEITYAEVKFKNESNSLHTYSESPAAPKEKPVHHLSKPGSLVLLFTSLMVLLLLLAITFLVAFITYFQKYSQLLEEKIAIKNIIHKELNCTKNEVMEDKVWSCCPKDWKPFGSHCYWVSTVTSSASWNTSEEKCSHMDAHLVVIHSKKEQDFLTGILNTKAAYFIGLWDAGHGQWRWVDQTPYNKSATFWHREEPSNDDEKCVAIIHRRNAGWGWNDIPCSIEQNSICQTKQIHLWIIHSPWAFNFIVIHHYTDTWQILQVEELFTEFKWAANGYAYENTDPHTSLCIYPPTLL